MIERFSRHRNALIALLTSVCIAVHLALRFGTTSAATFSAAPLFVALALGGLPLVAELATRMVRREFSSDLIAGIAIVTSVLLGEYLAGSFVVLMLSGGEALESYAVRRASSVLDALARRMPSTAHRKIDAILEDIPLDQIAIGDALVVLPHETCPVDGVVVDGHGVMDESYLTGEPFQISKTPGSTVISGAINGQSALTIRATKLAIDSRYAMIMKVMRESEQRKPRLRRLGDSLGAIYTPVALLIACFAWFVSGDPQRMLAVLVVATPCPLLIAIPVAIIGAISLSAKKGIIIKNPTVLEQINHCRTVIFDKTGTLTYGAPELSDVLCSKGFTEAEVIGLAAGLEQYSKHPLASAILEAARLRHLIVPSASEIGEKPGEGLRGRIAEREVLISSVSKIKALGLVTTEELPPEGEGLECVVVIDKRFAAVLRFRDTPRSDSRRFIDHLGTKHGIQRLLLLSGDRESEVRYLAEKVGITEVHFSMSPEEKVSIVIAETAKNKTMFVGDGINDAPALAVATVGIAFGQNSDVTSEAAGAVVMDASLKRVDELFHISKRMRVIALQSAVGGMALSTIGMFVAAAGALPPVAGAITQEVIDIFAVLNALRVALPQRSLTDY